MSSRPRKPSRRLPAASSGDAQRSSSGALRKSLLFIVVASVALLLVVQLRPDHRADIESSKPPLRTEGSDPAQIVQKLRDIATRDSGELPSDAQQNWQTLDNPAADGWTIELRAGRAKEQLDRLGNLIFQERAGDLPIMAAFCCSDINV